MDLSIKVIPTRKDKISQPKLAELNVIPRINSRSIFVGNSGSGKSTLVANLLSRKDMLGKVFDRRILISPTAKTDDIQRHLDFHPDDVIDDLQEAPSFLKELEDKQREQIEELGADKAPLILVFFDDVVSDRSLLKSKEFIDSFILSRHFNFTTFLCSQSYNMIPRKCRLQAKNIFFFSSAASETDVLVEDRAPPGFTKKEARQLVNDATADDFSFLHVNMEVPVKTRYRKNLDEVFIIQKTDPNSVGDERRIDGVRFRSKRGAESGSGPGGGPKRERRAGAIDPTIA
jgi:hypothetical protein